MTRATGAPVELMRGTLDLMILRTLLPGRNHGHAIAKHIQRTTEDLLQVETGSLYPALYRLEAERLRRARPGSNRTRASARGFTASRRRDESSSPANTRSGMRSSARWDSC